MKLKVNWPIFSVNNDYSNNHNANNNSKTAKVIEMMTV